MNATQSIVNVILKFMFDDIFESKYTDKEKQLIQGLRTMNYVCIEHTSSGNVVLRWQSAISKTVACYVDETGFLFSETAFFKESTRTMKTLVSEMEVREHLELVDKEISKFKKMFKAYAHDAEKYLK